MSEIVDAILDHTLKGSDALGQHQEIGATLSGRLRTAARVSDWRQALILGGYGGHVTIGAFSTPIAGGGATAVIDLDQPRGVISVAAGFVLIPLRITVQAQMPLLAADSDESEILIAADRLAAAAGLATNTTTEEVFNLFTSGMPNTQQLAGITAASAATGNITAPTLDLELARAVKVGDVQGVAADTMWTDLVCDYQPAYSPLLSGPAALYLYWGGTVATTGFAQAQFLCVPAGLLSDLVV